MISNRDNFFEGLPQVTSKKGKRNSTFRVTKAERQQQKVNSLEWRM